MQRIEAVNLGELKTPCLHEVWENLRSKPSDHLNPSHPRPVVLKPVGRIFKISDWALMENAEGLCTLENKGVRKFKMTKTGKMRTQTCRKCGKCA